MIVENCALPGCDQYVAGFELKLCLQHIAYCHALYSDYIADEDRRRRRQAQKDKRGWLYFIKVGEKIKVGYAFNPHQRLKQYPPGSEVLATRPGITKDIEAGVHAQLTQFRVAGREWYRDCAEIRAMVDDVNAEHGPPIVIKWGDGQTLPRRNGSSSGRRAGSVVTGFSV